MNVSVWLHAAQVGVACRCDLVRQQCQQAIEPDARDQARRNAAQALLPEPGAHEVAARRFLFAPGEPELLEPARRRADDPLVETTSDLQPREVQRARQHQPGMHAPSDIDERPVESHRRAEQFREHELVVPVHRLRLTGDAIGELRAELVEPQPEVQARGNAHALVFEES
ncbi:MAG: hypothetical protein HS109_19350 [Burkholderiales bacterium]|nr:hypothetical protein [Burkholderiales bacterium]